MRSLYREFATELLRNGAVDGAASQPAPLGTWTYIASSVINVLALALPLTILQVYDRVLPNSANETMTALILLLIGSVVVDGLLKYFRSSVINWSAASYTHSLSMRGLTSMLSNRPSSFSAETTSEHLERLNAIQGLGNHYSAQSRTVAVDVLFIPVFSLVIFLVGGFLLAAIVALFALFGYLAFKGSSSLNDVVAQRESSDSRKQDFTIEVLRAIQTVKAAAMEPQIMRRFESLQSAASVITRKMITLTGAAQTYNSIYASLSTVVIVSCGAVLVLNGRLTLGALACCMLLSSQLLQPLMRSLTSWNEVKLSQHRRERVESIFKASTHEMNPARFPDRFAPKSIELRNVTIRYAGSTPLFENLNLRVEPGQFIAITGADGCGRTTLLRSLIQDAPMTEGDILIDNEKFGCDAPNHLRRDIRYVGLNPVLFRGTILENITLFGTTPAKIALSAAKFTGLDEEVVRMPLGYDTVLKSSAGRDVPAPTAQRITITRALAMRPSVLILDEANTLLDLSGEQHFIDALKRLRGKVTTIIASHRPSLLELADRRYAIENGSLSLLPSSQQSQRRAS